VKMLRLGNQMWQSGQHVADCLCRHFWPGSWLSRPHV